MDAHPAASSRDETDRTPSARETRRDRAPVLVFDPIGSLGQGAWQALGDLGCELIVCRDGGAVLEEVIHRHPAAIVYGLHGDAAGDLALLQLVRRASPHVALVPIAAEDSLATRLRMVSLRPIYFAVAPIDPNELFQVITAAFANASARPEQLAWLSRWSLRLT
jgi:DNA-binding NtrC family response regulator